MSTAIAEDLLEVLNIVVFEHKTDHCCRIIGHVPSWFFNFYPNAENNRERIFPGRIFPFLDNFLIDADEYWATPRPSTPIKSGLWTELDSSGKPYYLEASALNISDKSILIVILSENYYLEKYSFIQTARSKSLDYISERKQATETLVKSTFYDALTGLPNQAFLGIELAHVLERHKQDESLQFAVLLINIDRFKLINNSLGQMIGDQLLASVAFRLKQCLNAQDILVRLGSDEFVAILNSIEDTNHALWTANKVLNQLKFPFNVDVEEIYITVSIGITFSAMGSERATDLLRDANTALQYAKELGRARYMIFDPSMHSQVLHLLQLETDLQRAIQNQELQFFYQPIISLSDFRIVGFEALVRWFHPQRGLLLPMEFLPIAEEADLLTAIEKWTLREACFHIQQWRKLSDLPLKIHLNLSSQEFKRPDLIEHLKQVLRETGINAANLILEVQEGTLLHDLEFALLTVQQLKQVGVQICIDDFGTCYSSLSYLKRLPVNSLKIERSFVKSMTEEGENVLSAMIGLAHNLGMNVIAEGVETLDHITPLLDWGCDYAQGHLFSEPVDGQSVAPLIHSLDIHQILQHQDYA